MRESLRLTERLAILTHSGPGEIERHRAEPGARQLLGDHREEAPILESFEPVTDDDGGPVVTRGPDIAAERPAVRSGQLECALFGCGHSLRI